MPIRPLGSELQKRALSELNEVPYRIKEDLEHILEWHQKEPHLNIRTDEQWLIAFLRGCKFSLQRTKEKLDYFYTMRTLLPEFFANRDPFLPEIQEVLKAGVLLPLPKTEGLAGHRIFLIRFKECNPSKISLVNLMKTFFMIVDVLMVEDDNFTVAGNKILADYSGFSLNYMSQYTPSFLHKNVLCLQSAYPLRIKGIYAANAPSLFEIVFNLATKLMNDKLKGRMRMYGEEGFHKVYEDIPQSLLTKECGGDSGSIPELTAEWRKKLEGYRGWFLEDAKYCSNESLRRGKPKTSANVFGVEGTFRKLAID